jgi:class 3 adenylate cyclase
VLDELTEAARRLCRADYGALWLLEAAGDLELKGFGRPITAYKVRGLR